MNKGNFLGGLAIMVGLIVLGLMLPKAVKEFKSYDRTVSVRGLCEREVQADKVIWPIQFKVVGNDLSAVYSDLATKTAAVKDFLTDGGIAADQISVATPVVSDKMAQEYGSNDRIYRYVATSTITVCTSDVDKVLALQANQSELLKSGIAMENDWDVKPEFSFEGLNDIKPEMVQEATQNAREVAQKFADDSGSKLGKIKNATQGYFTIENRDSNTPHIKKVRVVTNVNYYLKK